MEAEGEQLRPGARQVWVEAARTATDESEPVQCAADKGISDRSMPPWPLIVMGESPVICRIRRKEPIVKNRM